MPRTEKYIQRDSKDGTFSPRIKKEHNAILDVYCKANRVNKTNLVNKIISDWCDGVVARLIDEEET